jgi:rhodanese-related sulfurtransferase
MHALSQPNAPSLVLEHPPLPSEAAAAHAQAMLRHYTDPSDVHADLQAGCQAFVLLDARSAEAHAHRHIPGALSFPYRGMTAESVRRLPKDRLIVTYCDGVGCNASTKAALKLVGFGFQVKELMGGLDWWIRDGYGVETGAASGPACGC